VVAPNAPLYQTIAEALRREIETMGPNSILPSEQRLAKRFGTSRVTIRLALSMLERAGLLSRHRGRGTIVSPPKVSRHIVPVSTLEQDLREQGFKLETHVLKYEPAVVPPPHIRQRLGLRRGAKAGLLWLIREVDDRVICHDERYVPASLAASFEPELVRQHSVTDLLQDLAGAEITAARWETEITPVRSDIAEVLGVTPGTLVLVNTFTELFSDDHPAEAGVMTYRIDRVKFLFAASGPLLTLSSSRKR
jgi:GntR family transcriptional regulator